MIKDERGAALITTLLISMIIISISMLITTLVRGKLGTALEIKEGLETAVEAENMLQQSLFVLSTNRFWGSGIEWEEDGKTKKWHFDNSPLSRRGGVLTIQDTNGILPLWPFDPEKLERLLSHYGIKDSKSRIFIDSLKDWLDDDDLKHLNGAEQMAYKAMGVGYGPRNDYWQCKEELLLIRGMTPEIWGVLEREIEGSSGYAINPLTLRESLLPVALNAGKRKIEFLLEFKKRGELNRTNFLMLFPEYHDSMDISFSPSSRLIIRATGSEGNIDCTKEMTVYFAEREHTPYRVESMRSVEGSKN